MCSKGGFVPEDADEGVPGWVIVGELIEKSGGMLTAEDFIKGDLHSIHPVWLEDQLNRTLKNMNLRSLDLYYLHNPFEMYGSWVETDEFMTRLGKAFEFLESARESKKIGNYGMATWICFWAKPNEDKLYLNLQKVVELAEKVGGKDHGFKYVQAPVNVMMPEAFAEPWQEVIEKNEAGEEVKELQQLNAACNILKVNLITSQPLF